MILLFCHLSAVQVIQCISIKRPSLLRQWRNNSIRMDYVLLTGNVPDQYLTALHTAPRPIHHHFLMHVSHWMINIQNFKLNYCGWVVCVKMLKQYTAKHLVIDLYIILLLKEVIYSHHPFSLYLYIATLAPASDPSVNLRHHIRWRCLCIVNLRKHCASIKLVQFKVDKFQRVVQFS